MAYVPTSLCLYNVDLILIIFQSMLLKRRKENILELRLVVTPSYTRANDELLGDLSGHLDMSPSPRRR